MKASGIITVACVAWLGLGLVSADDCDPSDITEPMKKLAEEMAKCESATGISFSSGSDASDREVCSKCPDLVDSSANLTFPDCMIPDLNMTGVQLMTKFNYLSGECAGYRDTTAPPSTTPVTTTATPTTSQPVSTQPASTGPAATNPANNNNNDGATAAPVVTKVVTVTVTQQPAPTTASPESAQNESASKSKSKSTPWGIIGGGIAAAVVVLGALGFLIYRRGQHDESTKNAQTLLATQNESTQNASSAYMSGDAMWPTESGGVNIWTDAELLRVRIDYNDLTFTRELAHGSFGKVSLGRYANQDVVIKQLRDDRQTEANATTFVGEIKLMASMEHPRIVKFIGAAWRNVQTLSAVTEYMAAGDLWAFLQSSRAETCTWQDHKGKIATDVTEALVYLHSLSPSIIHRDLKSRNIMLDTELRAKLSDFGISRQRDLENTMTAGVGTARWMAPEVIMGGHYTEEADVYSLGVVLVELDTRKLPFEGALNEQGTLMHDVEIIQLVGSGLLHPAFTPSCPTPIVEVGLECMQADPTKRPNAMEVAYKLRQALASMQNPQYSQSSTMNL